MDRSQWRVMMRGVGVTVRVTVMLTAKYEFCSPRLT